MPHLFDRYLHKDHIGFFDHYQPTLTSTGNKIIINGTGLFKLIRLFVQKRVGTN